MAGYLFLKDAGVGSYTECVCIAILRPLFHPGLMEEQNPSRLPYAASLALSAEDSP